MRRRKCYLNVRWRIELYLESWRCGSNCFCNTTYYYSLYTNRNRCKQLCKFNNRGSQRKRPANSECIRYPYYSLQWRKRNLKCKWRHKLQLESGGGRAKCFGESFYH